MSVALLGAHCLGALAAAASLVLHRAWPVVAALLVVVGVDAVLLDGSASWQLEHALAFAGPCAVLASVALTVGATVSLATALGAPLLVVSVASVARGATFGTDGIALLLVLANAYAAVASVVLLRLGARKVHRFVAGICGLVIATCAPAIAGWIYLAIGDSIRAAVVVDCLFFAAIVVASIVEWIRWQPKSSAPSSPACSSTR